MEKSKLSKWKFRLKISLLISWFFLLGTTIGTHIMGEKIPYLFVYVLMCICLLYIIETFNKK
jgi:hypothetical protein